MKSKILRIENLFIITFCIGMYYLKMSLLGSYSERIGTISRTYSIHPIETTISIFTLLFSFFGWLFLSTYMNIIRSGREKIKYITNNGLSAKGELQKFISTDIAYLSLPFISKLKETVITFNVTDTTGETWEAEVRMIVPKQYCQMLSTGKKFNLKYLPKNKNRMIIIWS